MNLKNTKDNHVFKDLSYYQKEFSIWLQRRAEGNNLYQLNFSRSGTTLNFPKTPRKQIATHKHGTERSSRFFLCWILEELQCNLGFIFIICKTALRLWDVEEAEMIITVQVGFFFEQSVLS